MKRRNFLKKVFAGLSISPVLFGAEDSKDASGRPDLVAVRNGEPADMFEQGIKELGGLEEYIEKGQSVLVKPNIGWAREVETGADTHPELIGKIVEKCYQAGASEVKVFDHTCNNWEKCYRMSGIEEKASEAGATVVPANSEKYFEEVKIPGGKVLKTAKTHQVLLDSDVFINVPVIKHHGSTQVTAAMKNLLGVVWDRRFYHRNGLHRCIADFLLYRKPDLNIADGYRVTLDNGPNRARPEDIKKKQVQLISEDPVALDTAAARLINRDPKSIDHIVYGDEEGLGEMDLSKVNIKRITI